MWHGTHHSAQKSTKTGRSDPRTSASKSPSETWMTLSDIRVPPHPHSRTGPPVTLFPTGRRKTHVDSLCQGPPGGASTCRRQTVEFGLPLICRPNGSGIERHESGIGVDPLRAHFDPEM